MKKVLIIILVIFTQFLFASNEKYRLIIRNNASSSATIGWNQISGNNPIVYFGKADYGTNYSRYEQNQSVDRKIFFKGMNNNFVRLKNLTPNTSYYFVIKDSEGVSERFWFKTSPIKKVKISLVSGGDSRNNRVSRQNANKLVAKLKPNAILFGGDMTARDTDEQWKLWFDDWQLTISKDNQIFPIIATRGNHEKDNLSVHNLFDTPSDKNYYSVAFGENFIRVYTLNSEISIPGGQTNWLKNELEANKKDVWKIAQYHKPMRPHVSKKREGIFQYQHWANLFYTYNVQLVVESDAHTVKTTWPLKPSNDKGSEEGFIRDDKNGTIYVGEGCWGAPIRKNDDAKSWTRDSGMFNQFKWIIVSKNSMLVRTIKTDNANDVGEVGTDNRFVPPINLDIWNPKNGSIVKIKK